MDREESQLTSYPEPSEIPQISKAEHDIES